MKIHLLSQYGLTEDSITHTKMVYLFLEKINELEKIAREITKMYCLKISSDIAAMLLKKITFEINPFTKEYVSNALSSWISGSLLVKDGEFSICSSTISIPESDFEKFDLSCEEFMNYFNNIWKEYLKIRRFQYMEESCADGVSFAFELKNLEEKK